MQLKRVVSSAHKPVNDLAAERKRHQALQNESCFLDGISSCDSHTSSCRCNQVSYYGGHKLD
jgi:hypothetical protein